MDRGAWRITVHGVENSWTRLKQRSVHTHSDVDGPRGDHIKRSKWDKDNDRVNLKKDTSEPIYETERGSQTLKTNLWLPKGKGRGWRDKSRVWD